MQLFVTLVTTALNKEWPYGITLIILLMFKISNTRTFNKCI